MIGIIRAPLVVIGATGLVGRGVVETALVAGWPVIAVARSAGALAEMRARHPEADLIAVDGSVATDREAEAVAAAVRELGRPIGGVVVAVSSCANRGRLLDQTTQALACRLDTDVLPQLAAARAFLPLLARANRGGSYVIVGGPGSDRPWSGYGHRSIAASALRMLASVLHDEARPLGVRVQLLSVDAPVRTHERESCPHWPTARAIGEQALALMDAAARRGPARAVVPFLSGSVVSGSVSSEAAAAATAACAPSPRAAADAALAAGDEGLLTERWLEDTRTLLASIAAGDSPAAAPAVREVCPPAPSRISPCNDPSSPSDPHKEASP